MSAASQPISIASAASVISSPAPRSDDAAADDPFARLVEQKVGHPQSRPRDSERPPAAHGNTPLPYLIPAAFASFSVTPTQATSG
jgi:hypothetical protein